MGRVGAASGRSEVSPGRGQDWFASRLLAWFDDQGRKDLPWQQNPTPYRVWVSEVMLQQTQVRTVIPYYQRFMARFPTVANLAAARLDEVLHLWTGLGYYARGRNLHQAAVQIERNGGAFPRTREALEALPGVGRSTASAVLALAFGERAAILDGNVKRVLSRFHAVDADIARSSTLRELWGYAEAHTPEHRAGAYAQAIMDLGATLCARRAPKCGACPVAARCAALRADRVEHFPVRRRAKAKPVRKARMYVIASRSGACLLERRTGGGVWAGLWAPPERAADCTVEEICREFGIDPGSIAERSAGPKFRHTFSHFHLDIEPHYLVLSKEPALVADDDRVRWHRPGQAQAVGLPAPAVKLLARIAEQVRQPQ